MPSTPCRCSECLTKCSSPPSPRAYFPSFCFPFSQKSAIIPFNPFQNYNNAKEGRGGERRISSTSASSSFFIVVFALSYIFQDVFNITIPIYHHHGWDERTPNFISRIFFFLTFHSDSVVSFVLSNFFFFSSSLCRCLLGRFCCVLKKKQEKKKRRVKNQWKGEKRVVKSDFRDEYDEGDEWRRQKL